MSRTRHERRGRGLRGPKHIFSIEPQRRIYMGDAGWIECAPEEAERWALVQLTIAYSGKKQFRTRRVLDSFASQSEAARLLAHQLRKHKKR